MYGCKLPLTAIRCGNCWNQLDQAHVRDGITKAGPQLAGSRQPAHPPASATEMAGDRIQEAVQRLAHKTAHLLDPRLRSRAYPGHHMNEIKVRLPHLDIHPQGGEGAAPLQKLEDLPAAQLERLRMVSGIAHQYSHLHGIPDPEAAGLNHIADGAADYLLRIQCRHSPLLIMPFPLSPHGQLLVRFLCHPAKALR